LDAVKMIGDNPLGLYMFDKELGAREYHQASALK
ncbi:MAG: ferritin, partial [Bacteroidetes bacterium]|nr:ferritin [Bacteroidota bacterium]